MRTQSIVDLSRYFDPGYFRAAYGSWSGGIPDDNDILIVYVEKCADEKFNPNIWFNEKKYIQANERAARAVEAGQYVSGFHYWIATGLQDRSLIKRSSGVDIDSYLTLNFLMAIRCEDFDPRYYERKSKIAKRGDSRRRFSQFLKKDLIRGLVPTRTFNESFYIKYYADVAAAKRQGNIPSGYYHYVVSGRREGRLPRHDLGCLTQRKIGDLAKPILYGRLSSIEKKLSGIRFAVRRRGGCRVNVFVSSLDPDLFFGGYIAFLHFLTRLVERGWGLRLIVTEDGQSNRDWFLHRIRQRPRWLAAFRGQVFVNASDGETTVEVDEGDYCIAYSAWDAHAARQCASLLREKRFIYFIQEDETVFHEKNSIHFLVNEVYGFDYIGIFNTRTLRDYINKKYRRRKKQKDSDIVFEHVLADVEPGKLAAYRQRRRRTMVFYARPEGHASRNLFEIGILAIRKAVKAGVFSGEWDFRGVGTLGQRYQIDLGEGRKMQLVPRIPQADYEETLRGYDVGLSLMWAAHPSVLPFELAKAGVVTVTNEYPGRDKAHHANLADNLVYAPASLEGISEALDIAVRRSGDFEKRIAAGRRPAASAHTWDGAFDGRFFDDLEAKILVKRANSRPGPARNGGRIIKLRQRRPNQNGE